MLHPGFVLVLKEEFRPGTYFISPMIEGSRGDMATQITLPHNDAGDLHDDKEKYL